MTTPRTTAADRSPAQRPWTRLVNPDRVELEAVQERLRLHPLVVADLLEGRQQPKAETFDGHLYVSIWDIDRGTRGPTGTDTDLALILTEHELVLVQRGDREDFRDLDAVLTAPGPVAVDAPLSAAYRVLDTVVRDFIDLGTMVEHELADLEGEVFDNAVKEDYRRIYRLRQRIGQIDRASTGLADALAAAHEEIWRLSESRRELRPYFTHLENDARGVSALTTSDHEALDALVSSHRSNVETGQNRDMRTISAFAALLAVPTVIAGIYGMNFKNLPLVRWEYGWLAVGITMVVIDVLAYYAFRRRGWLGPPSRDDEE
ncbi:CorA family divalent cation transporter [Streptomyces sp. AC495_CC817]|uniref:CorA family divalent cation transporter n=1 Tax=Streptomyces sp. AC495_CC817 TaxID=2823900 RepID=UPI001C281480|nr:CorA family divalent cation transporter [Streptomyces sp. AC495_CC817]